jgi:hypothetical protein
MLPLFFKEEAFNTDGIAELPGKHMHTTCLKSDLSTAPSYLYVTARDI